MPRIAVRARADDTDIAPQIHQTVASTGVPAQRGQAIRCVLFDDATEIQLHAWWKRNSWSSPAHLVPADSIKQGQYLLFIG